MPTLRSLAVAAMTACLPAAFGQEKPTLYVVPYAHLDTQWRWSYPQVIREFLWNTMEDNFRLFEKYPNYTFNFGGSRRFEMMKEYFPGEYAKVVTAVKTGRWFPAPASVDETEVNIISGESVLRNVLYGNAYYRREFGVQSEEFMRPDSFGFPYSLPTLLVHAGLKGFSTQKLTWGSPIGIPFNVGMWVGPDGSEIASALNPTSYGSGVDGDLSRDPAWIARLAADPVPVDYRYYGTGDRGGAPDEKSVANGEASVKGDGPLRIVQSGADAMFKALTPAQVAKLPRYRGELLLTQHSAGSMSSHSEMKRWNRQNELLADAAERASVAAALWAGTPYPAERLDRAWDLTLGSQMHDMLPGTCLPKAYEYAQNDELLAQNGFSHVETDAVGAVVARMDTRAKGTPLVVYNPLSVAREDVVEAWVPNTGPITVFGPDGQPVATQALERGASRTKILFLAKVPSSGFASFDARPVAAKQRATVVAEGRTITSPRFVVKLDAAGDVASIYDKTNRREALGAPARLDLQHENPDEWPAWNMDWKDQQKPPAGYVDGPATIRVVENGPVRATIEVTRTSHGSKFVQRISLAAGGAGDRVEVTNDVDWRTRETALKAAFHVATPNPMATYGMQVGAIERGNNDPKRYEVPVHGWMDLTAPDGKYGVGVLSPFKYGSDKPDDATLRLTLIYTPGTHGGYQDQGVQEFGRHSITYGIAPHAGDWRQGNVAWEAARLAQPLRAFVAPAHPGALGKAMSLVSADIVGVVPIKGASGGASFRITTKIFPQIEIQAVKQAEDGDGFIVRLRELEGKPANGVRVRMSNSIVSAEEVDGQERPLGKAPVQNGALMASVRGYGLKAYRVRLRVAQASAPANRSVPLPLTYDLDAVSTARNDEDGAFTVGRSYAAEGFPRSLTLGGVAFRMGPTTDGAKNALVAHGQTISLPKGYDRVYVVAAATSDAEATFRVGAGASRVLVPAWNGYVGQWDARLWAGTQPELAYNWTLPFLGVAPGYVKRAEVAWYCSHNHHAGGGNGYYEYAYLFKQGFDLPKGATTLTLPNDPRVRVFAVSVAKGAGDATQPAMPLTDTLEDHVAGGSPSVSYGADPQGNGGTVTLGSPLYGSSADLRYTLDGADPTAASPAYGGAPIFVYKLTQVRVAQFVGGVAGRVVARKIDASDKVAPTVVSATVSRSLGVGTVTFSEAVDKATAEDPASYEGAKPATAALSEDGRTVSMTFGEVPADAKIAPIGVTDLAGNRAVAAPLAPTPLEPVFAAPTLEPSQTASFDSKAPRGGKDPWTINLWLLVDAQPADRTIIAGFGRARDGEQGTGRYLAKFAKGINFWSSGEDVPTSVPLDVRKWQMLTATYDGATVRIYKNGALVGSGPSNLRDDSSRVNVLPLDAWERQRKADGEVQALTIWGQSLPPQAVSRLYAKGRG